LPVAVCIQVRAFGTENDCHEKRFDLYDRGED
jgi:hypothetical protein